MWDAPADFGSYCETWDVSEDPWCFVDFACTSDTVPLVDDGDLPPSLLGKLKWSFDVCQGPEGDNFEYGESEREGEDDDEDVEWY